MKGGIALAALAVSGVRFSKGRLLLFQGKKNQKHIRYKKLSFSSMKKAMILGSQGWHRL